MGRKKLGRAAVPLWVGGVGSPSNTMSLGMEQGLGPGDFMLDGDPAPLPKRGRSPQIFGPCLLWPNGCVVSANSGSFGAHCVKVHVRYLIP